MKKLSAILLTLILVLALGTMAVSAEKADSPEVKGIVSSIEAIDNAAKEVSIEILPIEGKVTTNFQNGLKDLKKDKGDNTLKVAGQYDVKIIGEPEFPVTVTLSVLGISENSKVYIMVEEENSNVRVLTATVKSGKVTFVLERKVKRFAIVVDGVTAQNVEKENNITSPQTGNNTTAMAITFVLALVAAAFAFKKVHA